MTFGIVSHSSHCVLSLLKCPVNLNDNGEEGNSLWCFVAEFITSRPKTLLQVQLHKKKFFLFTTVASVVFNKPEHGASGRLSKGNDRVSAANLSLRCYTLLAS